MMVSNFLEVAYELPRLPAYGGVQCLSDYHCFSNGECQTRFSGFFQCICTSPYVGDYCQHTANEFVMTYELIDVIID